MEEYLGDIDLLDPPSFMKYLLTASQVSPTSKQHSRCHMNI